MDRHGLVDELWTDAGIVPSSYSAEHPKHYPKEASQQHKRPIHLKRLSEVAERVTQQLDTALSESGLKRPRLAGRRSRTLGWRQNEQNIRGWVAGGS